MKNKGAASPKYRMKQGVTYTMFNGVPYELVMDTKLDEVGATVTTRYVPAPLIKTKPTNKQIVGN